MNVFIEKENKLLELDKKEKCTGYELLKELHINPNTVILVKEKQAQNQANGVHESEVILADEAILPDDSIKIITVISGG